MSKFLAVLFLIAAGFATSLANFWFTFGIWPRSWVSYAICFLLTVTWSLALDAVRKEK